MRALIWIIILFAVAVGLAVATQSYPGEVYIVTGNSMRHINLNTFILAVLVAVVLLYLLLRLLSTLLGTPARMRDFGSRRRGRRASIDLNEAGLAFFEGRFQKAEQQALKVLNNKNAGDKRHLALMLAAHSADQMDNTEARNQHLAKIAELPEKMQLSRHLLMAESAMAAYDYPAAQQALQAARALNPNLTRLAKLELRYFMDQKDPLQVLNHVAKLEKSGALNSFEVQQYRAIAYRQLLGQCVDGKGLKACLKRIPEADKAGVLAVDIAEKYQQLGLYAQAVAWVKKHYPTSRDSALLATLTHSMTFMSDQEQRRAMEDAELWLKSQPQDAQLLLHLGQMAYGKQLWGKAQSYLEASLSIQPSLQAHLALAKVYDDTGKVAEAEAQRQQALHLMADDEHDSQVMMAV